MFKVIERKTQEVLKEPISFDKDDLEKLFSTFVKQNTSYMQTLIQKEL